MAQVTSTYDILPQTSHTLAVVGVIPTDQQLVIGGAVLAVYTSHAVDTRGVLIEYAPFKLINGYIGNSLLAFILVHFVAIE